MAQTSLNGTGPKTLKISRPAVYTFVGAVAVYAGVLLTQPDPPAPAHRLRPARPALAPEAGMPTEADLTAHFARYRSGKRNPFLPPMPGADARRAAADDTKRGAWTLTGINVINGVPNALLEDGATGGSVFLKPGDRWQGLRVLSIGTDAVAFLNALGQQTHLAFRPLQAAAPGTAGAGGPFRLQGLGTVRPMPVGPENIRPLPPLPPLGAAPAVSQAIVPPGR